MNCKPGDLAIFVACGTPEVIGRIVEVISSAPECQFTLPDGMRTESGPESWVIRFQNPLRTHSVFGLPITVVYGAARDCNLKPLRDPGDDVKDETLQWLPVPSVHKEAA